MPNANINDHALMCNFWERQLAIFDHDYAPKYAKNSNFGKLNERQTASAIEFRSGSPLYDRIENLGMEWLEGRFSELAYLERYPEMCDKLKVLKKRAIEFWFVEGRLAKQSLYLQRKL